MVIFDQSYPSTMMRIFFLLTFFIYSSAAVYSQAKTRKLSTSINHPSVNLYAPYMSADANAMVFISDNAEDNALTPFYTVREATDWREPQMLPKSIYSRLNFLYGFSLSADGKKLYYATMKSPGVGGYDIWYSEWKGSSWSEPVNPGLPLNTKENETCPSISPDGNVIYFSRCEKMDQNKADNCKIFRIAKKPNGQWDEPVELPSNINNGNAQAPRIMADGETLIFSSNKILPNKGGMDLYMSRLQNEKWSNPLPLDFVNTTGDDQYVSVTALGRYLLKDTPGPKKNELVEYLIPAELRPKAMMKVEGKISDPAGQPINSYIAAFDLRSGKRVFNAKPNPDGSFLLYLKEGTQYELSVDPEQNNVTYFSKIFDLSTDKIPQAEKVNVVLKPVSVGDEITLGVVDFKPNSSAIDLAKSAGELKRIARVINSTDFKYEIQVLLNGYVEDSVRSSSDLTEVFYDSVVYEFQGIDSLGQTYTQDSIAVEPRYHNNRTLAQAEAIASFLKEQGVNREKLLIFGKAIQATLPENKKLTIKVVAKPK